MEIKPPPNSRHEAVEAAFSKDFHTALSGVEWFKNNALGERDYYFLRELFLYPDIGIKENSARALAFRYGTSGVAAVLTYIISEYIDINSHDYMLYELREIHLRGLAPIRKPLQEIIGSETYSALHSVAKDLLEEYTYESEGCISGAE